MTINIADIHPKSLYTTMQLCRLLSVNKSTVNRWCNDGKLEFRVLELNGRRVYQGEKVLQMLRML